MGLTSFQPSCVVYSQELICELEHRQIKHISQPISIKKNHYNIWIIVSGGIMKYGVLYDVNNNLAKIQARYPKITPH